MNHAKKLISGLLSVVMLLVMATTAFAVDGDTTDTAGATGSTGSITIKNATVGEDYSVYKVFDLTYSENGGNVAYSYTSGENDSFLTALKGSDSPFDLTETQVENKYSVTLKTGKDASAISEWLGKQVKAETLTATQTQDKVTRSEVTFTNLPYGYYYVTSTVGTVATIDSTTPNVNVVDKNQKPSWGNKDGENPADGKIIVDSNGTRTVNSANYGDTVKFSIAINAVSYAKNAKKEAELVTYYHIQDTLGAGFDLDADSVQVKVGDTELTKGTDYTLNQSGKIFTVNVPFGEKYGSNAVIEVTYSATVNKDAVIAGEGNPNKAKFTYSTDSNYDPNKPSYDPTKPGEGNYPEEPKNPTYDGEEKSTTTYVYALGIKKVDETGNALQGAQFAVSLGTTKIYAKATNTAGVYEYSASANGAVEKFQTDDKGILIIKGLAAGKYSVKEVVAPNGYNLLDKAETVTASNNKVGTYTTKTKIYKDANNNVTTEAKKVTEEEVSISENINVVPLVVVNRAGTELPSTGGMGTTLFYALGGVLVTGAAILLVVKKRMERSSQ